MINSYRRIHRFPIKPSLKAGVVICLLFITGLFMESVGQSQPVAEIDTNQAKSNSKPAALDLGQIPSFGNKTRILVNDVQQLIGNDKIIAEISSQIGDVLKTIDDDLLIINDTINTLNLNGLEKKERELAPQGELIKKWREGIEGLSNSCQAKDSLINSMLEVWQLTLVPMTSSNSESNFVFDEDNTSSSADLKLEVEKFITDLKSSQINLENYIDTIRIVQTEVAYAENKLGDALSTIKSKKKKLDQNIWIPNSFPIWEAEKDTTGLSIASKYTGVIRSDWSIVQSFFQSNPKTPYYAGLLFMLVFGIILYLKANSKKLFASVREEPKDVNLVLKNPFLTAVVILWFSTLLFSAFPKELKDLLSLAMIVPLALILQKLNSYWKWYSTVIFSLTFLLFLVIQDVDFAFFSQRLFLIVINGFCIFLFWRFKKQGGFLEKLNKFWSVTFSFIIEFFIFAGVISLVANVFGSVRLAQLICFASLGMIISIYSLQAAVLLTRNLVFLILMGPLLKHSLILKEDSELVLNKMDLLFRYLGFVSLLFIFLTLFGIRAETIETAKSIINFKLKVGAMSVSLGNFLAFFLTLQISIWLSALIRYVLEKEVYPRSHFKPGVPNTISLTVKFTFALLGILLAFSAAGIQIDKLSILMGALGVGIGFGLQNIIANFVSGIILAIERPITIGDIIDIPDASGYVHDIGLRASTIRTWDGSHVFVPNGNLISNKLTNWTYPNDRKRRIKVEVRVPFDTDMGALSKLLLDIAETIPEVMKKPKAYLNFKGIGQSAMEIDLYCWTNDADKVFTYGTAIRKAVYKALREAGYAVPVPVHDVKIGNEKTVEKEISIPSQNVKIDHEKSSKTIQKDSKNKK